MWPCVCPVNFTIRGSSFPYQHLCLCCSRGVLCPKVGMALGSESELGDFSEPVKVAGGLSEMI